MFRPWQHMKHHVHPLVQHADDHDGFALNAVEDDVSPDEQGAA